MAQPATQQHQMAVPGQPPAQLRGNTSTRLVTPSSLLNDADNGLSWLLKADNMVDIHVQEHTFCVHRSVLKSQSEYFRACLASPFQESSGVIHIQDVEPTRMAQYFGMLYHCSLRNVYSTSSGIKLDLEKEDTMNDSTQDPSTRLIELIEVYKLSDRFISLQVSQMMERAIDNEVWLLFRHTKRDLGDNATLPIYAEAYDLLDANHPKMMMMREMLFKHYASAVDLDSLSELALQAPAELDHFVSRVIRYLFQCYTANKRWRRDA